MRVNLYILVLITLIGCSDQDKKVVYYENGNIEEVSYLNVDGELYGNRYYEDGSIEGTYHSIDGKLNGEQIKYYTNGNKKAILNYKLGIPHGKVIFYYESGKIENEFSNVDGVMHGIEYTYNSDGIVTDTN